LTEVFVHLYTARGMGKCRCRRWVRHHPHPMEGIPRDREWASGQRHASPSRPCSPCRLGGCALCDHALRGARNQSAL